MRRGWKILIGVLVALAVLLVLNTIAVDNETKNAAVTVRGGRILGLPAGDVQVLDTGEPATALNPRQAVGQRAVEPPIVLLHCYTCAIDWWEKLIPLLSKSHRVIAIDLLGHGGSEKPGTGYGMEEQAALVAQALNRLGVEGAVVVGHSLGGTVATALAAQSRELVDRLVIIDQAPDSSFGGLDFLAKLSYTPVLGEAIWRTTPDFAIKDGLGQAFAPGYDVPDAFVDDLRRMTFTSYEDSQSAEEDYTDERPLDQRIRDALVPLLVVFGSEDQIYDAREALSAYADVPGARTALIRGAGHSPNVEAPAQTAKLILGFAKPSVAPEPPPQKPALGKHPPRRGKATAVTAGCGDAIIGSGKPDYRRHSTSTGSFSLFGGGRDFANATRTGKVFVTKIPAVVAGHVTVRVSVDPRKAGLLYGPVHTARRVEDGAATVTFVPCKDKSRTVWPGGLVLAARAPVTVRVTAAGRKSSIRVG